MRKRDPGVLIIPDQRRDQAESESPKQKIESRPLEFAPMPRHQRENQSDRDQLKGVCVFAKKAEADQQPGGGPESLPVRGPFEREPEREHCGHPEEDRERIDRHDEGADVEKRDGVERDDRPESRALVKQFPREIIEKQTRRRAEDRAPEANTEFRGAENRGAGANRERDPRPFAKIRRREAVRPHPVMRLVEGQVARAEHGESDRRESQNEQPNCAGVAHYLIQSGADAARTIPAPSAAPFVSREIPRALP